MSSSSPRARRNAQQDALDNLSRLENDRLQRQLGVSDDVRRPRARQLDNQLRRSRRDSTSESNLQIVKQVIYLWNVDQGSDIVMDSLPNTPYGVRVRRRQIISQVKMDISPKGLVQQMLYPSDDDESHMDSSPKTPHRVKVPSSSRFVSSSKKNGYSPGKVSFRICSIHQMKMV